jgi:hypothetical protein
MNRAAVARRQGVRGRVLPATWGHRSPIPVLVPCPYLDATPSSWSPVPSLSCPAPNLTALLRVLI